MDFFSEGVAMNETENKKRPVDLRCGRTTDLFFPEGLPVGAVLSVVVVQERRGKRLDVTLPATAKIIHKRRVKSEA
jgi:hypothetical protein